MDKNLINEVGDNHLYPFNPAETNVTIKQSPIQQLSNGNHRNGDQNNASSTNNLMGLFQSNANANSQTDSSTATLTNTNEDFYPFVSNEADVFGANGMGNNRQRIRTSDNRSSHTKKPTGGYIKIIAKIILQSPLKKLKLRDIYCELQKNYEFFKESKGKWQNSVRHCLSSNDCFVNEKVNCHSEGKGGYWSVDVKNLPDLSLDCETTNESRRRRRIRQRSSELFYTVPREHILKNLNELTETTLLVYFPDTHSVDFFPTHLRDIFLFLQKKYNLSRAPYSGDLLRKLFREYFTILLTFGTEGYEQAMMLNSQFTDRNDGANSTEMNNQMMYHHIDPQLNVQNPPLFTRPMINVYDYSAGDPANKPPTAQFANSFPKTFDSSNYYQPRVPYMNSSNSYDKSMYSYANNKNITENPTTNYNNLYKSITINPSQFEPVCYNEDYMNTIYNPSSAQDPSSSNRDNQIPLYPPNSGGGGDPNSYVNPDFNNNHHPSVIVDAMPHCNDIVTVNSKIYAPFDKENISNNIQNPLLVHPNEGVFNFPPPIAHVNNVTTTPINSIPIQPCFNNNGNISKHGP